MKFIPLPTCAPCRAAHLLPWILATLTFFTTQPSAVGLDCTPFKVWTFNIRYNDGWICFGDCENEWYLSGGRTARRDTAESYMKASSPDIFGLQEVRDPAASSGVRASQLDDVASWFPNHDHYARDRGDGEHCAIFYRKTRFVRVNAGTFWISCFPDVPETKYPLDDAGGHSARIASWVQLFDSLTGTTFYVFNTHWSHVYSQSQDYAAALLRQRAHQIAAGQPVIILGDFNATENNTAFKILTGVNVYDGSAECVLQPAHVPPANLPLANSYRQANPVVSSDEATHHDFTGDTGGPRIDHVLHTTNDFTAQFGTIRRSAYPGSCGETSCHPSDHFAVEILFRPLLPTVFVNFQANEIVCEIGTALSPFNSLDEGLSTVKPGGTIALAATSKNSSMLINPTRGPITITSAGGASVLGK